MSAAPLRPARSIEDKLVRDSAVLLAAALLGLLAAVIWINLSLSGRQQASAAADIRRDLIAKGATLVANNSLALEEMVADNAFLAVAKVVSSTVKEDEDVVYGVYMTAARQPWVNAHPGNPPGLVAEPTVLGDSASLWASRAHGTVHRAFPGKDGEVIEFAAPVRVEDAVIGFIRYGLTTARMHAAIAEADRKARQALWRTLGALVGLGALAMSLAVLAARRQAKKLTRPIQDLQAAAGAIARGDYGRAVAMAGDDEIGLLAADFETMRLTVKEYTEHLEDMVAAKIREIKDILDNIEQGLFTVGLDGKVNPDYALATHSILRVDDVASRSLGDLFRIGADRLEEWMAWLDLVRRKHAAMRWDKLSRLSPIQELRIPGEDGAERSIQVGYQRMYDRSGRLSKLMILVQDVTEARRVDRMIREEKERHENEVKAILGLVGNAASMPDFLEDAEERLGNLERAAPALSGAEDRSPAAAKARGAVLRDLHTLKGTSSTYGFEALALLAREAEDALADGLPGGGVRGDALPSLLSRMQAALEEIRALSRRLSGHGGPGFSGESAAFPVPERKLDRLRNLADAVKRSQGSGPPEAVSQLLRACRSLDQLPLSHLAERYRAMVERVSHRLGKRIAFSVAPGDLEMTARAFSALDEPLVHLIRNAADHGIEPEGRRLLAGKEPVGRIALELEVREGGLLVSVSDDGGGIDADRVAAKAEALGLVEGERLAALSAEDKLALIFAPGLSTRDGDNGISGRGVGLDAVAAWARGAGGSISVSSPAGSGTRVTLALPAGFLADVG